MRLNFSRSALFHINTTVCLIYFDQDCSLKIKDAQKTDFAKSINKDEYIKMFETEIASKEITTEKVREKLELQNQSDLTEVKKVYDMIRYVIKKEGNVNSEKVYATKNNH